MATQSETQTIEVGSTLANGATVVNVKHSKDGQEAIVLATWRGEFVTWRVGTATREAVNGHYFSDYSFHQAVADFDSREA